MALAWLLFSITLLFLLLDCPPWPQTGLVYIDLKLVFISNFLPKFGLQKCPISPKNGENPLKQA
jgi:hypothetical protein